MSLSRGSSTKDLQNLGVGCPGTKEYVPVQDHPNKPIEPARTYTSSPPAPKEPGPYSTCHGPRKHGTDHMGPEKPSIFGVRSLPEPSGSLPKVRVFRYTDTTPSPQVWWLDLAN